MKRKLFAQNVSERKTHSRARDRDRATITRTVIQCFSGLFLYKGQPQLPPEKQIFSELKRGVWGGAEREIMILFFIGEVLRDPVVRDVESELPRQPDIELLQSALD